MDRKKNRWKYGIWSAFVTILGVLLAVILVWVAERATERFGLKFDLTANDRYAISEQSVSRPNQLDQDVKITVLVNEEDMATGSYYIVQAYQNLLEYERNSDRITLEFVDITENPTFVSKYPDLELGAYDIILESGEQKEVLSFQDLYDYDTTGSSITASRVEQKVTGALMSVTSQEKTRIMVLDGYQDTEPSSLTTLLEGNQYEIIRRSLLTEELDDNASAAILFAPQNDLEEDSIRKISAWLDNDGKQGRNLFVFLDPNTGTLLNLEAFLEEWGLDAEEGYAFEARSGLYYNQIYYPVAQYAEKNFATGMSEKDITVLALCRPVDVLFEEKDGYETQVLLDFSESSGKVTLDQEKVTEDMITGDVKGMVKSAHHFYGSEVTTSNVVLSGSSLAFNGTLVSGTTFANGRYILGVFDQLTGNETSLHIPEKDLSAANHTMTAARTTTYSWMFLAGLPAVILVAGVVIWVRRRHR